MRRRELADAIADREAADAVARQAKAIADKADRLLSEASDNVQRLKTNLEAVRRSAVEHRARAIAAALRDGLEPSAMPAPQADMTALHAAEAHWSATEAAAHVVAHERDKAADAASSAANTVNALIAQIRRNEADALATSAMADLTSYWQKRNRLSGICRVDPNALSEDRQREIVDSINWQKFLARKNPQLAEMGHWLNYLDDIAATEQRRRLDYEGRLATDATAKEDSR